MWGKVKGMPPAPDRQDFLLVRWSELTFVGAPRQPARLVFDFTGTVACDPRKDGTTDVTHAYGLRFKGPFRVAERYLDEWLQRQVEAELRDLAALLVGDLPR